MPYLAGAAGQGGYDDVISPATDAELSDGDVLMLDTGLTFDGYFCDFDRNFALGHTGLERAHTRLIGAIEAGRSAAIPGARARDVYRAMRDAVGDVAGAVRLGHGLGMQLTEWPSLSADDDTELTDGMVLTLEPCITTGADRMLVHEEVIVLGDAGNCPPEHLVGARDGEPVRLTPRYRDRPRTALGLVILASEETLERAARAMIPSDTDLFVSRVTSDPIVTPDTLAAMEADLPAAAALFPKGRDLDAVGYACTSGAARIGPRKGGGYAAREHWVRARDRSADRPRDHLHGAEDHTAGHRVALYS